MKLQPSVAAASLALVTTSLVTATGASPAQAATGTLKVCASDNYTPTCLTRSSYDSNLHNDPCDLSCGVYDSTFGDDLSSFQNNSGSWWKLYEDKNYGGFAICVRPHGYDANIGNNTDYEDDISSLKRFGSTRPTGCDQVIG